MSHFVRHEVTSRAAALSDPRPVARASRPSSAAVWIAFFALLALLTPVRPSNASSEPEAQPRGEAQSCLAAKCHEYRTAFWTSPHSALDTEGLASRAGASWACAACHGEPKERHKEPGEPGCTVDVFSFLPADPPNAKAQRCLTCHSTDHPGFALSPHARAGLDCTTCHAIHEDNPGRWPLQREVTVYDGSALQSEAPGATCVGCHTDVFAEFEQNERHRLHEGILVCTDCHDPHRRQERLALGGFKQDACAKCHRDRGGPFLFEHDAQRVEGCVACHSPHGSPNRHLLAFQHVAELCFSCHVAVPGFHASYTLDSQCTNCHSSIHGSNLDSRFLK